ncbi:MAG: gamma-glutamyltransferase [Planctomycetes bacterium]|nr:gamma-glutamyltransferase [Planctomycetota bacterium]
MANNDQTRFGSRHVLSIARTLAVSCIAVATWTVVTPRAAAQPDVSATHGVIVSVSPRASNVGLAVLRRGGTAVDASVATAFALAVTWPEAGNIGGGGFMLIHPGAGKKPVCVDYRETAPAASTEKMFVKQTDRHNHLLVGVPGTVRGLALAHSRFGKLPWRDLLAGSIKLAGEGFEIDETLARGLNSILAESKRYKELQRVYGKADGSEWKAGDRLVQPDLAATLRRIAEHGADEFYTGKTAELLAAEMKAGGGIITMDDLAGYRAKVRRPIHGTFRGHDVYGPPPPSSGGICLVQMLNVLERFPLRRQGRYSPETLHLMIETMRRSFRDRAEHLGDADFVKIPEHLTTKKYAAKLAASIDLKRATSSESLAGEIRLAPESKSTTHFSVIDRTGMAVSNTYTLEQSYGSRVVVRGAGFLLNNEMGDFNWRPGHTDRQGRIGTPANRIVPGKRMLSSQCPVIVAKDGRVVLATGSPGGRTIINTSLCIVLNVLEFQMPLERAVRAPRIHHQWFPDQVRFEGARLDAHAAAVKQLQAMGHKINPAARKQGDAHSIHVVDGEYRGVADRRRRPSARAVGF